MSGGEPDRHGDRHGGAGDGSAEVFEFRQDAALALDSLHQAGHGDAPGHVERGHGENHAQRDQKWSTEFLEMRLDLCRCGAGGEGWHVFRHDAPEDEDSEQEDGPAPGQRLPDLVVGSERRWGATCPGRRVNARIDLCYHLSLLMVQQGAPPVSGVMLPILDAGCVPTGNQTRPPKGVSRRSGGRRAADCGAQRLHQGRTKPSDCRMSSGRRDWFRPGSGGTDRRGCD